MGIRDYQVKFIHDINEAWDKGAQNVMGILPTGSGKCLARGTPVMMFDGTVKAVEDVKVGEFLMGPDSQLRIVVSLARGREAMYRVVPKKGDSYTVNESHILSVKLTRENPGDSVEPINVSVLEYLAKNKTFKHRAKGWKAAIDWEHKDVPLDPYFLGIWLGDGSVHRPEISKPDPEIKEYVEKIAAHYGLTVSTNYGSTGCPSYAISTYVGGRGKNCLKELMKNMNLIHNKHIPHSYKANSREVRLQLLAGLLDTDGHATHGGYDFVIKEKHIADDVVFICRSLGLAAYAHECTKGCQNGFVGTYHRVYISGDCSIIPMRIAHKKSLPRKMNKDVTVTGISLHYQGVDDYFGFEITGPDRLFLLGDFTVTHNTFSFTRVIAEKDRPSVLVSHRQELVSQAALSLNRESIPHSIIAPQALVTEIIRAEIDTHGRSFYQPRAAIRVAGVNTITVRDTSKDKWFSQVEYIVMDEGHHVLKENVFGKAVQMFPTARGLFVSAHAIRSDNRGLGRHSDGLVDTLVIGPSARQLINRGFLVDYRLICPPSDIDLSQVSISAGGDFTPAKLSTAIHASSTIVGDVVREYMRFAEGKLGLTFAVDIEAAKELATAYQAAGIPTEIITGNTSITERVRIMRRFRARELLQLVSVDVLGEGTDVPAVEVISMARPTKSFQLYCLDPETEVLTPDGWKRHSNTITDIIAFNPTDSTCSNVEVTASIKRPLYVDEKMIGVKSPHLDVLVSDQHRMLVRNSSNTSVNWMFETAVKASTRKSMFVLPVAACGSFEGANLSTSDLLFLGWYLSDGTVNRKTNAIVISQSCIKEKHLAHIRSTIQGCRFKFREYTYKRKNVPVTHNDQVIFSISYGTPRGTDKHLTGWSRLSEWIDKSIPKVYDQLTRAQLLILLESLNLGDGNNNHDSLTWTKRSMTITCGDNEKMADRIQALCVQRGLRCNKSSVPYSYRHTQYYLYIKDTLVTTVAGTGNKNGSVGGKKPYKRSRLEVKDTKPDFVWCLSSDAGTLITRRNGKVTVMGNCQQFGRSLRVDVNKELGDKWDTFTDEERKLHIAASGKPKAIIIDHVNNWDSPYGLPDKPRTYTLDRREKKAKRDNIPLKLCAECLEPYEAIHASCPNCGATPVPRARTSPEAVEGDLYELDPQTLAALRGEIEKVDGPPPVTFNNDDVVGRSIRKNHRLRQDAQSELRGAIALWAGYWNMHGASDRETYRRFFLMFDTDIMSAQTLRPADAKDLEAKVRTEIERLNVIERTETGVGSTVPSETSVLSEGQRQTVAQ